MLQTLRNVLGLIERGSRARWLAVVVLAIAVSFVEAAGALLIYFVVGAIADPDRALKLPLIGDLRDRFPGTAEGSLFRYTAIAIAVFFLFRGALTFSQVYFQNRTAYQTGVSLSGQLMRGYLRMPFAWHLRRNSADMIRTAYESVTQVVVYGFIPSVLLLSEGLVVLVMLTVLLVAAPLATLLVIVVLGAIVLALLRIIQPRLGRLGETYQEMSTRSLQSMQQSLHGIRDIKVLGREEYFTNEFVHSQGRLARTQYLRTTLTETPRLVVETLVMVLVLAFVAVQGLRSASTDDSLALLGLFGYAALRLMPAMNRVVTNVNYLKFGVAATTAVGEDLKLLDRVASQEAHAGRLALQDSITVERVSFRYESADFDVLSDIDLTITAGQSIGLVGSTGGGKTTLIDAILGLLEPTRGSIKVDGVDIRENIAGWHRNLGVVPQTPFLVDDTLRRNVALGLPDDEIDDEAVADALRLAQLETFVASLPEGWDAVVGERGVRLSGGQRQRVAIARALYRRPAVLVFDEGTSALDNLTEAELIAELEQLRGERTLISVAHRITTVRKCDLIVIVEGGRIIDVGAYKDLLARSAAFRQLAG